MKIRSGTFFRIEKIRGEPRALDGRTIVPIALAVSLGFKRGDGACAGFAWTRPLAIEVADGEGVQRRSIPDAALSAAVALSAAAVVPLLVYAVQRARRSRAGEGRR